MNSRIVVCLLVAVVCAEAATFFPGLSRSLEPDGLTIHDAVMTEEDKAEYDRWCHSIERETPPSPTLDISIVVIEFITYLVFCTCVVLHHHFAIPQTRSKAVVIPSRAPTLSYMERVTPIVCYFMPIKDLAKLIAEYSALYDITWEQCKLDRNYQDNSRFGNMVSRQTIAEVSRFPWAIDIYPDYRVVYESNYGSGYLVSQNHINPLGIPVGIRIVNRDEAGCLWVVNRGKRLNRCDEEGDHPKPLIVRIEFHATAIIVVAPNRRHELPLNGELFQDRTLQLWTALPFRQNISAPFAIPFDQRL